MKKLLVRKHLLVRELNSLADQMSVAMVLADTSYVSEGYLTPRMQDILFRYQCWAIEAKKVGL